MNNKKFSTFKVVFVGVMAAVIYVVTMFRFPLLGSKVHFANAMCLLSGMLFGPLYGGLSAGFGSGLYDLLNGYPIDEALVTFVSKFAMAWVCAKIAHGGNSKAENHVRNLIACIVGALTYVALYMLKQFIYGYFIKYNFDLNATFVTMLSKLPGSLINAAAAIIVTPPLFAALHLSLKKAGLLEHMY